MNDRHVIFVVSIEVTLKSIGRDIPRFEIVARLSATHRTVTLRPSFSIVDLLVVQDLVARFSLDFWYFSFSNLDLVTSKIAN